MKFLILILPLILAACGTLTKQQALTDAETVIAAGAVGYFSGGKAGAVAAATNAELNNLRRIVVTAAKNPPATPVTP